ncbi:protein of unknown function [Paraburkholderia dioscoreae]|uniref:Uncharacterized protein n=1 Tax=Paraburkholderia dioscoreae TaxID=2604047 RepID=A0A5Q4ZF91_9BURK|nr:protein of unknown function [Paraburkholderia dioscoreae]
MAIRAPIRTRSRGVSGWRPVSGARCATEFSLRCVFASLSLYYAVFLLRRSLTALGVIARAA